MPRNLDLTALRSFVTVAERGGVTRASGFLNLTQSAVSMQLKRLEEALGLSLIDRSARTVALTDTGQQLLGYARRILDLNDEAISRMTDDAYRGEIVLGVPHDIIYPAIPAILRRMSLDFPQMQVRLHTLYTRRLKEMFAQGECDFILTTEDTAGEGGETLVTRPLIWIGAAGGAAYRERPLPVAFCNTCIFRAGALRSLDEAGIPWRFAVDSDSDRAIDVTVAADLGVHAVIEGMQPPFTERLGPGCGLPDLKSQNINMYRADGARGEVADAMAELLRGHYRAI